MKILQVMAGGDHGGAETAFVDMCLAMADAGMDIQVATRPNVVRVPMLREAGLIVHELPFGGALDVFTNWRIGKIIRDFSPLIVQTWMSRAAQKTPSWRHLKSPQKYLTVARLGGYYKLSHFKTMDYFAAITPDIARYLEKSGIAPARVRQINNFAETETARVPVSRADLSTPDDAPLILALGRLHESKAHDILIRAVTECPGVYLWIAGEGPDRAMLEALIASLNVGNRVRLLGWRTDRAALLQAADICAFVSRYEPFGTVFVQAWAQGVPVIVSDADGPRQYCRDGEDSLVVPKDDVSALESAIQRLLGDPALRERLVGRGSLRAVKEFGKEKTVAAYLDFYVDILKKEGVL